MINIEMLASFRVKKKDYDQNRAINMDAEEVTQRRTYLKQLLQSFPEWEKLSDALLDQILVYPAGDGGYILKDENGRDYYLTKNTPK